MFYNVYLSLNKKKETLILVLAANYAFMVFVTNEKLPLWKDIIFLYLKFCSKNWRLEKYACYTCISA